MINKYIKFIPIVFKCSSTTAPNLSARNHGVGNAYFVCSQSNEIKREYVDSNRKRIDRFDCKGKLTIHVDLLAAEAKITLRHNLIHDKPTDIAMPSVVKQEIKENLEMTPTYLRSHLRKKFDLLNITSKQIYYWWSHYTQQFYKFDEDHVVSALKFFEQQQESGCDLCFQLETKYVTAIGFTTPLLALTKNMLELHCDATYKMAKGRFELYGLVGNIEGMGFLLGYLILDTTKASNSEAQEGLRTEALTGFFHAFHSKGLNPIYFYTDKDFAQRNAAKNVWPESDIQLCLWHLIYSVRIKNTTLFVHLICEELS